MGSREWMEMTEQKPKDKEKKQKEEASIPLMVSQFLKACALSSQPVICWSGCWDALLVLLLLLLLPLSPLLSGCLLGDD